MKIIVCVKQVPDTNEVRINNETGTLIRTGVQSIINPDDMNALEAALSIAEEVGDSTVTVISMGPPQAKSALREALAMGADEAILLSDRVFGGSDTWATATVLAAAIEKIGDYDMVICGRQAIDGDTAQVGPEIAEFLGIPQITYATDIKVEDHTVFVNRKFEDGHYEMKCEMPVLITAIKELNEPRYCDARLIFDKDKMRDAYKVWTHEDIPVDLTQIGVRNSPTNVYKSYVPTKEFKGVKLEGRAKEIANQLFKSLKEEKII